MKDYILATCSTADISLEHMQRRNIEFIQFSYYLDDKEYHDDLGQSMSMDEFYNAMVNGAQTRTSQPNAEQYASFVEPFFKQGKDVVLLNLSSGLSGAQTSAKLASQELKEKYPEREFYVIDSLGASSGMGLLIDKMADLRDEGMSAKELYEWAEANKLKVHHWFFSTDLTYYVRGGRVSKVAGWFGTILKICPLLNMDNLGHLVPREKIRGKAGVIKRIVKKMEENADNGLEYSDRCYICHASALQDAKEVKELVEASFPNLKGKVLINNIGTTIGSHTGPGTVALFFFGNERAD
ncbi:MAG: DegV family protein [Clostridia bacterium]|nr:DegV family protein [Clostridia bacterium]